MRIERTRAVARSALNFDPVKFMDDLDLNHPGWVTADFPVVTATSGSEVNTNHEAL
jgi:hypothetical protein